MLNFLGNLLLVVICVFLFFVVIVPFALWIFATLMVLAVPIIIGVAGFLIVLGIVKLFNL